MRLRHLRFLALGILVFFLLEGCSFYAGIGTYQAPRQNDTKMAANVQQEGRGRNSY